MALGLEDETRNIQDLREFIFDEFVCQYALMPLRQQRELLATVKFAREVEVGGIQGRTYFPVWLAKMIASGLKRLVP